MEERHGKWSDQRVESVIGNLLRFGVITAAIVVVIGGFFYIVGHGHQPPDYRLYRGEPTDLTTLNGIGSEAISLSSRGIIQSGILLLIAVPIVRVAFSIFAFARQRDYLYLGVTVAVFIILMVSFFGAIMGR